MAVAPAAPAQAGARQPAGQQARASAVRDVSVNLFQWNWPSVARECTAVLGPRGFGSVQVSPPQNSLRRTALGNGSDTVLHPWWEVYQPADYTLNSRFGTTAQFVAMVKACRSAGVDVVVDAIVNHMTGQGTTSYGGSTFTKYSYPGIYGPEDFHAYPGDCPVAPAAGTGSREGNIEDFNDYRQVFECELVGLSDLRTESAKVRRTVTRYLNTLLGYGVAGFRIDAGKHVSQADLSAILGGLRRTVDGKRPYVALEVMPGSPGQLSPTAFLKVGDVLGFDYATQLQTAFKSYNNPPNDGNIGSLRVFGEEAGLLPSDKELVFVQNHDTERNGSTLNYKDPNNVIANQFMLAYPHGTPQVYSGFAWSAADASPPADATGRVTDTVCNGTTWVCVHRNAGILGMVRFHNAVGSAPVANWYDDGVNLVAFSRGDRGFFATNNRATARTVTVRTGLRAGTYCDVVHGTLAMGRCSGPTVTVGGDGRAKVTVGARDSVAFTTADRIG
jgi:alpha-amylase